MLADRYRLTDLLTESGGGRFWRAFDTVLHRDVAVHIIACADDRAPGLRAAARTSATVLDRRMLRVLDIDEAAERCFVVNEWGSGTSLDLMLADAGPLSPTVAAWIVSEVADTLALAHEAQVAHGRLVPENVLIANDGSVRLIGFAVDAALHGLPAGRVSTDVADLAGLLYAALTGRWAGVTASSVPRAPSSHGHVLRPRQVRAGIPRTLDALCDHVLNHGGDTEVSAAVLADELRIFLGPSATAAELWLARIEHPARGEGPVVLPPLPDPPARESAEPPGTAGPGEPHLGVDDPAGSPADPPADGLATQAGLPIFHEDTDEVSWLPHHAEKPPPPPDFEPQPERPLFAPDPEDGQPVRRPRAAPATQVAGGGGFWPWEGAGTTTGSGLLPAYADEEPEDDRARPGTSMLRLAGIIAACVLVLVAVVVAFNLGRGKTPLGTTPGQSSEGPARSRAPSGSASATPVTGLTASDFDPQGSGGENAAEAPSAVDGRPGTAWTTLRYDQQFGPQGLKTGVGLVLDLGASHDVTEVDLTTVGAPTGISIYVSPDRPTDLVGLQVAGRATLTSVRGRITLAHPTTGRYVVVWLTRLPKVAGGGFRGGVAEAVVKGD
ncbi:MAG TPA: protein kinase family protein [Nocardioides sp.]|uniref:protein kinase family protein n=1 Tax=Nocardioides sp. TaxID=35761 RepID=UPI002E34ABE0|nr:protein kinase family protein [Nocardioides sp.]HEX3930336.1 protein kinase family protein [Nocardioides sp.]